MRSSLFEHPSPWHVALRHCLRKLLQRKPVQCKCAFGSAVNAFAACSDACLTLQVLRDRLLAEAEASVQLNADVAGRWGRLFR